MIDGEIIHVPKVFYIFAGLALFYFFYNFRRAFVIKIGRREALSLRFWEILRNLVYYGIGQRKVSSRQFTYATIMHLCLGWGFIELFFATSIDFLVERGVWTDFLPAKDTPWFAILNEIGGLLLFAGVVLAIVRRYSGLRPEPLPHKAFRERGSVFADTGILVLLLLLVAGGFIAESARLAIENPAHAPSSFIAYPLTSLVPVSTWITWQPWLWWSHAGLALILIALLPQTKLFHILMGIVNVALTNNAERGNLRSMNIAQLLENPEIDVERLALGAGEIREFSRKQLLDVLACTECARCTSVCPAYATGKPLSPMKIIQDLRHNLYGTTIGDRVLLKALIGELITPMELWSCTSCGACMEVCPVLIDHIPTIIEMRRHLILSEGKPPQDAASPLEKTSQHGNPWGFPRANRLKWALDAELDVPVMSEKKQADVLYWVGCAGAYDPRNQEVSRALVTIFRAAGVDYAVLGEEENCTGDFARRMGEEYLYETLAQENITTLSKYTFNKIVTPCPHCFQTIGFDYRQLGANWQVLHHSTYLEELICQGRLALSSNVAERVTYHDPCYLGRHHGIYRQPRELVRRIMNPIGEIVEMTKSHAQSFCCGAGGGNMWYEIDQGERINTERLDQAVATGAETIATACSYCLIMLDDALKVSGREESVQLKDIAELVAGNLSETDTPPGIKE
ncbi:(Fe-S)-binding protein [Candidatus Neomarinimicrobiota bacterium]